MYNVCGSHFLMMLVCRGVYSVTLYCVHAFKPLWLYIIDIMMTLDVYVRVSGEVPLGLPPQIYNTNTIMIIKSRDRSTYLHVRARVQIN